MSIQLVGSALIIRGKTVVNSKGDVFADSLSANTIDIKNGGVKIVGGSTISGDLTVNGNIIGGVQNLMPYRILNKCKQCLVELVAKSGENNYNVFSGVFVSSDGWVITSANCVLDSDRQPITQVWGTIIQPNKDKEVDVISSHHIFVDKLSGLCVIKFPDIANHDYLRWADTATSCIGERCYCLSSSVAPFSGPTIQEGGICFTHFECDRSDCVIYDFRTAPSGGCAVNTNCELMGVMNFECKWNGEPGERGDKLFGSINSRFAKHSMDFMISNLKDYDNDCRSWLGIIDQTNVTHIEIIISGLLGMFPPKGKMIDVVGEKSPMTLCKPQILSGNIVTHIDGIELNVNQSINDVILDKPAGSKIDVEFITPPSTTVKRTTVTLGLMPSTPPNTQSLRSLYTINYLRPTTITKSPYYDAFALINNKNAQIIYEATHEKEIKQRKKMYLINRLKVVKTRKKSRSRVKSRRKS